MFRPGHADYPFTEKYGIRDYREAGVLPVGKQSAVSQQARMPLKS